MHGSPLSPFDNRDLWKRYDFRQFGLAGEAYLSIDYHRMAYFTDAGRSWADNAYNLRDRVAGEQTPSGVRSTTDLITAIREKRFDQMCISAHPERWASNLPEWLSSLLLDLAGNTIKASLRLLNLSSAPDAERPHTVIM
jgi:succinylglutamate desuccinylase